MSKTVYLFLLLLLLTCGCQGSSKGKFTVEEMNYIPMAQRYGLPEPSGGFVLAVGDQTVTAQEVINPLLERLEPMAQKANFAEFAVDARPFIEGYLVRKVSDIMLYNEAKKEIGAQAGEFIETAVESEIRRFVISFGNDYAKAEDRLKQMGMTWGDFREHQKRMILSQSYLSSKMPEEKPLSHGDLLEAYNRTKSTYTVEAKLQFQLIDIVGAKLQTADANKNEDILAKELAADLVSRLNAGENFGDLAKQYSHGYRKDSGGMWEPVDPGALAKPYDILTARAQRMNPGDIAGPIETKEHIFIMKLIAKQAENIELFESVQKEVEAELKLERNRQALDKVGRELFERATFTNKDQFVNYCLRQIYMTAAN